jgi:hypothetical protein
VDLRVPVRTHKRRSRCEGWLPLEAFRVNRRADPWGIRSGGIRVAGVVMSRRRRRGGKRTPIGLTRTTSGGGRSTATSICSGNGRVQSAVGCLRSGRVRLFVHLGAVSNARASSEDTATGPPDPPRVGRIASAEPLSVGRRLRPQSSGWHSPSLELQHSSWPRTYGAGSGPASPLPRGLAKPRRRFGIGCSCS